MKLLGEELNLTSTNEDQVVGGGSLRVDLPLTRRLICPHVVNS